MRELSKSDWDENMRYAVLLERSIITFKKYSEPNLSYTDAVSIEIMNEFKIENYFGFDAHFKGIVDFIAN